MLAHLVRLSLVLELAALLAGGGDLQLQGVGYLLAPGGLELRPVLLDRLLGRFQGRLAVVVLRFELLDRLRLGLQRLFELGELVLIGFALAGDAGELVLRVADEATQAVDLAKHGGGTGHDILPGQKFSHR